MAHKIPQVEEAPIVWAHAADYGGGDWTHELDLTALANGAARQGVKADLGEYLAARYRLIVWLELDAAPLSGAVIPVYWAASRSAGAGVNNPAGTTGADALYTGTAGDSLLDSLVQLILVAPMPLTSDAATVVQRMVFTFTPPLRYGMPVVYNTSLQALEGDAIEMAIKLLPIIEEIQ